MRSRFPALVARILLVALHWLCQFTVAGFLLLPAIPAQADWVADGKLLSVPTGDRYIFGMLPDSDHGAFVAWIDTASPWEVIVVRINAQGQVLWTSDMAIAAGLIYATLTPVAEGGVQMTAQRTGANDTGEVVIQRVDAAGHTIFNAPWKVVARTPWGIGYLTAALLSDGETQVAWTDSRLLRDSSGGGQVFGQRLDVQGNPLWEEDGRRLVPSDGLHNGQDRVWLVPGANGTFFLTWNRVYTYKGENLLPGYVRLYGVDGVAGPPGVTVPYFVEPTSDGANGVIASWPETSDATAQRVSDNGSSVWGTNVICACPGVQRNTQAVADGSGGAYFMWDDTRNGNYDVYAQRVDASGAPLWSSTGVPVIEGPGDQYSTMLVSDGAGGVIISWYEYGLGDLYAQRLGPTGDELWGGGVPVSTATGRQFGRYGVLDGLGGVLLSWGDTRFAEPNYKQEVFAQRLSLADGSWGSPVAVAISSFAARVRGAAVILNATLRSNLGVDFVKVYRAVGDGSPVLREASGSLARDRFQYVDDEVMPATEYRYQLAVGDADGEFLSPIVTVTTPALEFSLEQNQPNPFNPSTTIRFVMPASDRAVLRIYAPDGALVRTLFDDVAQPGSHEVNWDGRDAAGIPVSSGVYFCRLQAGKQGASRKLMLLK